MGLFLRAFVGAPEQGPMDRWLLGAVLILAAGGLLMVYSSSNAMGVVSHRGNDLFYLESQLARAALGVALLFGLSRLDVQHLSGRVSWVVWIGALLLLALLFFPAGPGVEVRGTRRWLSIGGQLVQPAEFARLALTISLAALLARRRNQLQSWRGLLAPVAVVVVTSGLIALQPHLSMALLTAAGGFLLIFLAGAAPGKLFLLGGLAGALGLLIKRGYQVSRISGFISGIEGDPSYQVHQSILGIGSGGLTGMGLGQGMQKHFFLPDPHTDFIMSIVGEELGLVGLLALFVLTALIALRIFSIGRHTALPFGELVAYGIGLHFIFGFLLHAAVCLGWAPTTGVPYPLMSFGGSALIANLIGVGLILSISRGTKRGQDPAAWGTLLMEEPCLARPSHQDRPQRTFGDDGGFGGMQS